MAPPASGAYPRLRLRRFPSARARAPAPSLPPQDSPGSSHLHHRFTYKEVAPEPPSPRSWRSQASSPRTPCQRESGSSSPGGAGGSGDTAPPAPTAEQDLGPRPRHGNGRGQGGSWRPSQQVVRDEDEEEESSRRRRRQRWMRDPPVAAAACSEPEEEGEERDSRRQQREFRNLLRRQLKARERIVRAKLCCASYACCTQCLPVSLDGRCHLLQASKLIAGCS